MTVCCCGVAETADEEYFGDGLSLNLGGGIGFASTASSSSLSSMNTNNTAGNGGNGGGIPLRLSSALTAPAPVTLPASSLHGVSPIPEVGSLNTVSSTESGTPGSFPKTFGSRGAGLATGIPRAPLRQSSGILRTAALTTPSDSSKAAAPMQRAVSSVAYLGTPSVSPTQESDSDSVVPVPQRHGIDTGSNSTASPRTPIGGKSNSGSSWKFPLSRGKSSSSLDSASSSQREHKSLRAAKSYSIKHKVSVVMLNLLFVLLLICCVFCFFCLFRCCC